VLKNFIHIAVAAALGLTSLTAAANDGRWQQHTRVMMEGAIFDSPCSLMSQSRSQSIHLAAHRPQKAGEKAVPFNIQLQDCVLKHHQAGLPDWHLFAATFEKEGDSRLLALRAGEPGPALAIADAAGHVAQAGVPLAADELNDSNRTLHFTLLPLNPARQASDQQALSVIHLRLNYF